MERSTAIAVAASGVLILAAGAGAVAAVGSLQQADQDSLSVGQAQPQAPVAVSNVAAVPRVALKVPKLKAPAPQQVQSFASGNEAQGSSGGSGFSDNSGPQQAAPPAQDNSGPAPTSGENESDDSSEHADEPEKPENHSKEDHSQEGDDD